MLSYNIYIYAFYDCWHLLKNFLSFCLREVTKKRNTLRPLLPRAKKNNNSLPMSFYQCFNICKRKIKTWINSGLTVSTQFLLFRGLDLRQWENTYCYEDKERGLLYCWSGLLKTKQKKKQENVTYHFIQLCRSSTVISLEMLRENIPTSVQHWSTTQSI